MFVGVLLFVTSNCAAAVVGELPMPTRPVASMRRRSVLAVLRPTELSAGKNKPFVGTVELVGMKAAADEVEVRTSDEPVAAPMSGVTKPGEVAKTRAPVPVSSVTAAFRLADVGVARNVAIPEARPEIPVLTGRPVAFVRTAADGVPRSGVTSVGEVFRTTEPVPVLVVTPVPPFSTGRAVPE